VTYAGGKTKTVIVNQKQIELANKWYSLGEFRFDAGTGGNVMLSNDGTDHSVSADVVKWVYKAR